MVVTEVEPDAVTGRAGRPGCDVPQPTDPAASTASQTTPISRALVDMAPQRVGERACRNLAITWQGCFDGRVQFGVQGAIEVFRKGLRIDPLSATLYYDLSLVLRQTGDAAGADRAFKLAARIDPALGTRAAAPAGGK